MELGGLVQTLFPKKIDKQDNFTVSKMSSNVAISESDWYNYTSGFDFDSLARGQSRFFKPSGQIPVLPVIDPLALVVA